jgi:D-3-phosphoglycerate dehydrogenase
VAKFLIIDEDIHPSGPELLRSAGSVEIVPSTLSEEALLARLTDTVGVLMRKGRMTARLIEGAPQLRIIARHGVGVDSVDLAAAARREVIVTITGAANVSAVAEYAMGMLLAVARHIPKASADVQSGIWKPNDYMGVELGGKTLGLVGLGQIGRLVAERARAFGMRILVIDPFADDAAIKELGAARATFEQALPEADFLSFHVRLTDQTRNMFGREQLRRAKRGVRIVNTARGGICDEDVLLEGLETGAIAGIALDTFAQEPLPTDHPLRKHPRAILTPHIAGQSEEAMIAMSTTAAESIIDCIEGRRPRYVYAGAA